MRIGIDCRSIAGEEGEMAGIGHYAFFLARHLLRLDEINHYILFFNADLSKAVVTDVIGSARNVEIVYIPRSRAIPYLGSHRLMTKKLTQQKLDIFHALTGSVPMGYKGKTVITVHDLAIYLHPEWFPGRQIFSKRIVVPASIRRAERVISVSESTKKDIMKIFSIPSEKISVIYEGVEFHSPQEELSRKQTLQERYGLDRPYFFSLGTIEPRKNHVTIIEAFVTLAKKFPELLGETELIIAGGEGWKTEYVFKALKKAEKTLKNSSARIRYIGYIPGEDKWGMLAESVAFLFPSLYEGFGLPVLEAMSLAVPVITTPTSSIPEITGRNSAILVDEKNVSEWVLAMKHILEDPMKRADLGRLAQERATEFGWQKTAGETLDIYEEAFKGGAAQHIAGNIRLKWIDDTLFHSPHRPL